MSLFKIDVPDGVTRQGTIYQVGMRWWDTSHTRVYLGNRMPIGGWVSRLASTLTGAPRAMIAWRGNDSTKYYAVATHSKLYVATPTRTAMVDITPAGFTAGRADAVAAGGYGSGTYGSSTYGDPRVDSSSTQPATVQSLDTFGQYLLSCSPDDGKIYEWQLDIGTPTVAAVLSGAPTSCVAVVVTPESFVVALGAGGDKRKAQWSDQGSETTWTPSSTNQAGSYSLQTQGQLVCGKRTRSQTLLFTDTDVHLMTYIGLPYVYTVNRVGENCGIIAPGAAAVVGADCFWMSYNGFWRWDGASAMEMACEVYDAVFGNLNRTQRSKVSAWVNSQYSEIVWCYPSASSTENDSRVRYNYLENKWYLDHSVERTCGMDRGIFTNPMECDSTGHVYDAETGVSWGSVTPYFESGPLEDGAGDAITRVRRIVFDEQTQGDVRVTIYARDWNNGSETTYGPYTSPNPVSCRIAGRQLRMKWEFLANGSFGAPRFDAIPGGKR